MKVKILSTTDGKHVGVSTEIENVSVGDTLNIFNIELDISFKSLSGNVLTLASPNYIVRLLVKE